MIDDVISEREQIKDSVIQPSVVPPKRLNL